MTNALATMRVDYDQVVNIKNLHQSNNPLLKKRMKQVPEGAAAMQGKAFVPSACLESSRFVVNLSAQLYFTPVINVVFFFFGFSIHYLTIIITNIIFMFHPFIGVMSSISHSEYQIFIYLVSNFATFVTLFLQKPFIGCIEFAYNFCNCEFICISKIKKKEKSKIIYIFFFKMLFIIKFYFLHFYLRVRHHHQVACQCWR